MLLLLTPLLFGLSFVSGMLGLGAVALVALAVQRAWILLT